MFILLQKNRKIINVHCFNYLQYYTNITTGKHLPLKTFAGLFHLSGDEESEDLVPDLYLTRSYCQLQKKDLSRQRG